MLFLVPYPSASVEVNIVKISQHRVIMETDLGMLVFAFYPDIAPLHTQQITRLINAGAYDSTHFFRVIPGFIIQTSEITDRNVSLTQEQNDLLKPIKAEFTDVLKHRKGVLSMARMPESPDSARSSFSIMLGNAPHLDGEYTIFGQLESGGQTLARILAIPRNGENPASRITINRAYVVKDIESHYQKYPRDPVSGNSFSSGANDSVITDYFRLHDEKIQLVVICALVIIALNLVSFLFYKKLSKAMLLSIQMITILISSFLLFVLLTKAAHHDSWLAIVIFTGLFLLFRLMSQFENRKT